MPLFNIFELDRGMTNAVSVHVHNDINSHHTIVLETTEPRFVGIDVHLELATVVTQIPKLHVVRARISLLILHNRAEDTPVYTPTSSNDPKFNR